jgi:hypothetical protein
MKNWLLDITFRPFLIAKTGLGKFIVLAGCLLHLGWAGLLILDERAAGATPLSAIYLVCGSSIPITVFSLLAVSALSIRYLVMKAHNCIKPWRYALLMLPQLWMLSLSLLAGIYATWKGYYIDTVAQPGLFTIVYRPRAFIFSDQLPVMVLALLYITAAVFACVYRVPTNGRPSC